MTQCQHPTFHGPTPDGGWICNKCGDEVQSPARDWVRRNPSPLDVPTQATSVEGPGSDPAAIPPPGTEECDSSVTMFGREYRCQLAPPHTGHDHRNGEGQVSWAAS